MKPILRTAMLALACCLGLSGCLLAAAGAGAGAGFVAGDQNKANHTASAQHALPED
jgi:hypothetical protein